LRRRQGLWLWDFLPIDVLPFSRGAVPPHPAANTI